MVESGRLVENGGLVRTRGVAGRENNTNLAEIGIFLPNNQRQCLTWAALAGWPGRTVPGRAGLAGWSP